MFNENEMFNVNLKSCKYTRGSNMKWLVFTEWVNMIQNQAHFKVMLGVEKT